MRTQKRGVLEKIQTYLRIQKAIEDAKQQQRSVNRTTDKRPKEVHKSTSTKSRLISFKLSQNGIEYHTTKK